MNFKSKHNATNHNQLIIDAAWDEFSDYIGEHNLQTPLSQEQFEEIFLILNKNDKFSKLKNQILKSFRYDSYAWPLVKREESTLK